MRAIWTGGISFGLVYIPIKLYSGASEHNLDLDMLRAGDQCPIKYVRVCQTDGKEVPWDNIVKGYKMDDFYVVLENDDFKKARPEKSESISIVDFVKVEEINPRYFEKPYLTEPQKGAGKTYNLLREAILQSGMAGIAKFVLRNREHLCLLMADEKVIFLNQMRFHSDMNSPENLKLPDGQKPGKKELDLAVKLIKQMSVPFKPENYKDDYQEKLKKIIEAKSNKEEIKVVEEEKEPTAVKDLMEQLKKSLQLTN